MSESFLSTSQTFIGVLTTIVLLCIISGSEGPGNFLYTMVNKSIKRTRDKVNALQEKMVNPSGRIDITGLQERFTSVRSKFYNSVNAADPINAHIEKETFAFRQKLNNYSGYFSKKYFTPIDAKLKEIEKSEEQTLSPLYVFGFCITLFVCDELFSAFLWSREIICRFLFIFTLTSSVFLSMVWLKFNRESKEIPTTSTRILYYRLSRYFQEGTLLLIAVAYFLSLIAWLLCTCGVINLPVMTIVTIYFILTSIALLSIGNNHTRLLKTFGYYRYSFIFFHFIAFALVAFFGACMLELPLSQGLSTDHTDLHFWTKAMIIIFTIFFGLITPFLYPYRANCHIHRHAQNIYRKGIEEIENEWTKLDNWLRDFESECERLQKEEQMRLEIEEFQKQLWYY